MNDLDAGDKKAKVEDDLQILQEIPGKSSALGALGAGGPINLSALLGGASGSGTGGGFFNPPSILQAQDPYFSLASTLGAAGSSSSNTMDILQKCKF